MINAICKACGYEFLSIVIQGLTVCPECGSQDTAVAIYDVDGGVEAGSSLRMTMKKKKAKFGTQRKWLESKRKKAGKQLNQELNKDN